MKPDQQQRAIEEACGWTFAVDEMAGDTIWWKDGAEASAFVSDKPKVQHFYGPPKYLSDLNAMHEAEKVLNEVQKIQYYNILRIVIRRQSPVDDCKTFDLVHATAAQRAEAFLRTIGKWQPS